MEQVKKNVEIIVKGIQEKKGSGITVINLAGIEGAICRYFVICQGNSPAQVDAIADSVECFMKNEGGEKPVHTVGRDNSQWIAIDYTDVMVHVFLPETREYYALDSLWQDAEITNIPDFD